VTINVGSGSLNPFFGGVGVANNSALQPFRNGTGGLDPLLNFVFGDTIDGSDLYLSSGPGGSQTHLGSSFTAGTEGYVGFKLNGSDYGWMRVVFTNNTGGAVVKDWAYENSGAAISVGGIRQVGSDYVLSSGFTVGSAISDSNGATNLLKNSSGSTTTLAAVNTYTGTTSVTAGTLAVSSAGTINTSSSVSVAAGSKFIYNSSTALTVGTTLNGTGTSAANRAVLGGTGTINTAVTLDHVGDVLSPGAGPGTGIQNFTPAQTWSSFSYDWEVKNFTGTTAGTDFDQIGLASTLNLDGGSGDYILNVLGLTAGDVAGLVPNFSEIDRSWTILSSTGTLTGFDVSDWTINTAGFTDPYAGTWALAQSGNTLVLSYTAIPEPNVAALIGGFGMLCLLRRRR
jgi:autotransporter-associated beta strand protein